MKLLRLFHFIVLLAVFATGTPGYAESLVRIQVSKSARILRVYQNDKVVHEYKVALGSSPIGHKMTEGDRKTPEGRYYICSKNSKSRFFLSLGISYPNTDDAAVGLASNLITQSQFDEIQRCNKMGKIPPWNTKLGGEIMIHGCGTASDWTWGCIALENSDVKELFDTIEVGTPVELLE